jgi:hypothetical protein
MRTIAELQGGHDAAAGVDAAFGPLIRGWNEP